MILVTGATGLVGAHILHELSKSNSNIKAMKRKSSSLFEVEHLFRKFNNSVLFNSIQWVDGDITDITTLNEVFKDVTEVYHVAGMVSFDDRDSKKLYSVNVKGTANMVNYALAYGIKRFLYISSISVIDAVNNEVITEKSEFLKKKPHSKYACSKFDGEMEVWRGSQEGLEVIVANTGVVLGSGFKSQSSGQVINQSLKGYYTSGGTGFVSAIDVAKCSVALMKSESVNERFILVSENVKYEHLVNTVCSHFKRSSKFISDFKLNNIRKLSSFVSAFGFENFISKASYESLITKTVYDNSKVIKTIDYAFEKIDKTLKRIMIND